MLVRSSSGKMKNINQQIYRPFFLLCLLFSPKLWAGNPVTMKIKEACLYTSGVRIISEGVVQLEKGIQEFRLEGLSPQAEESSLSFKCSSEFTLMSIQLDNNPSGELVRDAAYRSMEDSIRLLNGKLSRIHNQLTGLQDELAMIRANQKIAPAGPVQVAELEKAANFFRTRVEDILNRQFEGEQVKLKLQERLNLLQQRLQELGKEQSAMGAAALVVIKTAQAGKATFQLAYNCAGAGWSPLYDIQASGSSEKVGFIAKASVWQSTGTNWKDVKISLSTGSPGGQQSLPSIMPWYLSLSSPGPKPLQARSRNRQMQNAPSAAMGRAEEAASGQALLNESSAPDVQITEGGTQNVYEINGSYNLRSNGSPISLEIQKFDIPARFQYLCRPRQEKAAFLEARLKDWGKSGLLPGQASIFMDGDFVGKTLFETQSASDTLSLSFGKDQNISVEKKQIKYLHDKSLIGSEKSLELGYELMVKNRKSIASDLVIEEQIPLSPNAEARVELLESSGANFEKETGMLRWILRMKAGESTSLRFRFRISYPKTMVLGGGF